MRMMVQDFRYAFRMLSKRPAYTAVVVLTLALGIGVNTAIFSVISGVLVKPLPYQAPEQLVVIESTSEYSDKDLYVEGVAYQNFLDWRRQNEVFSDLGAYQSRLFKLLDAGEPERIQGALVTAGFFSTLGVSADQGRLFGLIDEQADAAQTMILSHGFWQRRFGADPAVIGRTLTFDRGSYTVVGVLPAGFNFPMSISEAEAYTAIRLNDTAHASRNARVLGAVARLKAGVDCEEAQAQMSAIAARLEQQYPEANENYRLTLVDLHELVAGDARAALLLLQGAAGIVLLIACANCANLFLTRYSARSRELAIRKALGAGRTRLIRQLLTESMLAGLLGGLFGIALAYYGSDVLIAALPAEIPLKESIRVDGFVLGVALIVSALTGLVSGFPAAFRASRQSPYATLKESGPTGDRHRQRLQGFFVVTQTALALVMLVGAGLLIRSFVLLTNVDPGFSPENVLAFRINISEVTEPMQRTHLLYDLQERIGGLPGVQSAAVCRMAPLGRGSIASLLRVRDDPKPAPTIAMLNPVSERYFDVMQIPLMRGRVFTELDVLGGRGVAIIDENTARRIWPNDDPMGKRISLGIRETDLSPRDYEIVGIVGSVRSHGLDIESPPLVYVPYKQHPHSEMTFALRTTGPVDGVIAAIRKETASVIRKDAPFSFTTMSDSLADSVAGRRCPMQLLGVFAALAMILATVGVYGMLSYAVSQRTHEIGIRMALGARSAAIMAMTFKHGALLVVGGLTLGIGISLVSTRILDSQLYGISALDPITFVGVSTLLTIVAAAACYLPARRATRIDPLVALRYG